MPLHHTIGLIAAAALLALVAAAFVPRLRRDLRRPAFWAGLIAIACLPSAASALVARTGHAGTGFVTRHGWPKPFWFDHLRETGERFASFEPLYFAGNVLVYAAILLVAWTLWRILPSLKGRGVSSAGSARPGT
ncbi:MAG TPA: hypothetical protein VD846_14885 [Allosphingosinicella sp.]|nr:hypothetical protein [Allosphingosinicella sp.]